ncbi:methyltransferase domain-containing protein, partial [Candidatus Roizmanbacteria bacterium]|nr:methyltransferase domain-containing protein [Candidatus Roizmanbacteria bacterium]
TYLKKYGGAKMERCDGLDINYKNKKASIYGDLRNLKKIIPANRYDVIILTQILGMIDDVASAIGECYRILKPGGWLIGTSAYLSPYIEPKQNYWRFTTTGIHYLLNKFFEQEKIRVGSYGNVLAGQAFWVGLAQEDLRLKDLEYNDPHYPLIIAFKAQK